MKNLLLLFALFFSISACKKENSDPEEKINYAGTWQLINSSMISPRSNIAGGSCQGKGYVGLGYPYSTTVTFLKDWWEFDPVSETWTQKSDFPGTSDGKQKSFSTQQNIYVIDSMRIYAFNFSANQWTRKNDFPGDFRTYYFLTGSDTNAFLGMGVNQTGTLDYKDWWQYSESADSWNRISADFPGNGNRSPAGFCIRDNIYLGQGSVNHNGTTSTDPALWKYSMISQTWSNVSTIPYENGGDYGFVLNGKGYFVGGVIPVLNYGMKEYNPQTNSWQNFYDEKCSGGGVMFVINDQLYLFQGFTKYVQDHTAREDKFWRLQQ